MAEAGSRAGASDGPSSASASKHSQLSEDGLEWRASDQGVSSSGCPLSGYWDSDDDVDGKKPADLYGKFTWKIETFSEISKRELRSNIFEVGGYKWYILVYPQGCDVCNHLSLFLCVADYDKLLPGWNHFAQFTIAVVNKDPKKSKYSDTLHRFCKKEHDWGWKKFMELSKVLDGFTVADTLVIKAQVQVIRENPMRPFRCLDCQYRRELVRVYLTNVESICRRFVEEKREKLGKLLQDSVRWASLRAFWDSMEDRARQELVQEKRDVILRAVVKRFFNDKEVTSTLVMDALYSGCRELQSGVGAGGTWDSRLSAPVVCAEAETFILAGDALALLERAAVEPMPLYKDNKGPQMRSKEIGSDDGGKEAMERDERRLTELGRRSIEMFVLAYLFSNRVEVAYREAVALKRQEELIREEEAAELAESELRTRREQAERDRRAKKKQAKQRKKDRRDKEREDAEKLAKVEEEADQLRTKAADTPLPARQIHQPAVADDTLRKAGEKRGGDVSIVIEELSQDEIGSGSVREVLLASDLVVLAGRSADEMPSTPGNVDPSEAGDSPEADTDGDADAEVDADTDIEGLHKRLQDDGSSSCSSDSLASLVTLSLSGKPLSNGIGKLSQTRHSGAGTNARVSSLSSGIVGKEVDIAQLRGEPSSSSNGSAEIPAQGSNQVGADPLVVSLRERVLWLEHHLRLKEEEVLALQQQLAAVSAAVPASSIAHRKAASQRNGQVAPAAGVEHEDEVAHAGSPSSSRPVANRQAAAPQRSRSMDRPPRAGPTPGSHPADPAPEAFTGTSSPAGPFLRSFSTSSAAGQGSVDGASAPPSYRNAAVGQSRPAHIQSIAPSRSPSPPVSVCSEPEVGVVTSGALKASAPPFTSAMRDAYVSPTSDGACESGKEDLQHTNGIAFGTVSPPQLLPQAPSHQAETMTTDLGVAIPKLSASRSHRSPSSDSQGVPEDFPHLALINDLLDEDVSGVSFHHKGLGTPSVAVGLHTNHISARPSNNNTHRYWTSSGDPHLAPSVTMPNMPTVNGASSHVGYQQQLHSGVAKLLNASTEAAGFQSHSNHNGFAPYAQSKQQLPHHRH